jgi:hypothetical protein
MGTPPPEMEQTVIEHWTGGRWEMVSGPQAGGAGTYLGGISCAPSTGDCYAVGSGLSSLFLALTGS